MSFPGSIYAPPGVYTQTNFEDPLQGVASNSRVPLLIGTGSEILTQNQLELVRGSSSSVDQRIVEEDETGRAVVSISQTGAVTLGSFDGNLDRVQVKNFPIVTGDGSGSTTTDTGSVSVTINGEPVVVLAIDGSKGILKLSTSPKLTDEVRVTYFFNRTDTLITDNLSDQVTLEAPVILGSIGETFVITLGDNDTLNILVDNSITVPVTIAPSSSGSPWTAAQISAFINSAASSTTLQASTSTNNFGQTVVKLQAASSIEILSGTSNTTLGFTQGDNTVRNNVFYSFQKPIVDGSNGGITTTDPADVTVKVNGVQVIPTSVDGKTGRITLPFAPKVGSTISCQYFFNSWQDTFDYLAHRGVQDIFQCGITPDRNDYVQGVDFILKDDIILWGSASTVESGIHTQGFSYLDGTQISTLLVDNKEYLASCTPVVNTSVNPPVEDRVSFTLPLQPTTGNGRNTPLSSSTYSSVSNGRTGLPTNRPDLVFAYWGFSLEDALDRGRVTVSKVDSDTNTITLSQQVPVGATVYATFYYNTLVDQEYSVVVNTAGPSGVGTYSIKDADGDSILTPKFSGKSAGLASISMNFPSGAESTADCRFEAPFETSFYVGSVEEDVTVEFALKDATLAKYSVPGSGPYYTISNNSDHFDIEVDGSPLTGGFVDLQDPTGVGCGFHAQLTSNEVEYEASSGNTTYTIDNTNNSVELLVDGKLIQAKANTGSGTVDNYVNAINQATLGLHGTADVASGATTCVIPAINNPSNIDDYYVGWSIVDATAAPGTVHTVTSYVASTRTLTTDGGNFVATTNDFHLYDVDSAPSISGVTKFLAPTVISLNEFDELGIHYVGSTTGSAPFTATIAPGTYTSAALLATAVNAAVLASNTTNAIINVTASPEGKLVFSLIPDPTDTTGGFIEFVANASYARDFAEFAGIDTDSVPFTEQAKLVNGNIARRFTFTGGTTGQLNNDRIILRNRIVSGHQGNLDGESTFQQASIQVLGGSGNVNCGLEANELAIGGITGTVQPPTMASLISLSGGQDSSGNPIVTFYGPSSTNPQNNVFKFTFEGTPVTVLFTDGTGTDISTSADVPLGPITNVNSVLGQIQASMVAQGLVSGLVRQEGVGIRFRGTSSASSANITIGNGSANDVLGFSTGDEAFRTVVEVETLVSALMAHSEASITTSLLTWENGGSGSYFTAKTLAKTITDNAGKEFLFLQSLGTSGAGTTSSIAIVDAASDSITLPGTGIGAVNGDGNVGETSIEGFFVTSSDPVNGSGTANTSVLNNGNGQDGNIGQTYRDSVTGLTFTILPRDGGAFYPTGESITFSVRKVVTCDSNLPVNSLPGIETIVSNTLGVTNGDTAIVSTYSKSGLEPSVGDVYYVSYNYKKQDFSSQIFTKMSTVEQAFGTKSPTNPVSLGAYLAFLNGAVILAIKQVEKDVDINSDGSPDTASLDGFLQAIDSVEGSLPGGIYPNYIVPMKGDSLELFQYLARHCDIQSSIRYRAERTAIVGVSAGTQPKEVGNIAEAVKRSRLRLLYPDIVTLSITEADGSIKSYLVDGTYFAAAWAGNRASPTIDVATPWTRGRVVGFDDVARKLDAVQQNQIAVRGVTVLSQDRQIISIRHGLTTDPSNQLTRTPSVITIADEVQRKARATLDRFVGIKFLPGITSQVEGQLNATLKGLVRDQIISTYIPATAKVSVDDPTAIEVEAYYQPVFPLIYIVITFNVRSSL